MKHCKTVLIVEDDTYIRSTLKHLIETEGYLVFTAENGHEALGILRALAPEHRPCLMLVDFMMPIMDGAALIKEMQLQDCLASIPVIMVSAQERPEGIKRFIKKPYSIDSIIDSLKEFCS